MIVGIEEGIEINLLGLVFGVDPLGPAIKFPGHRQDRIRGVGNLIEPISSLSRGLSLKVGA